MEADSGKSTVLVLLDLSSAFDKVDHPIMTERLRDLVGMSGPVSFTVSINNIQSNSDVSYHLFSDDIHIYCSFNSSEPHKLSSLIICLSELKQWLNENSLQLNSSQTQTLITDPDSAIPGIKHHLGDLITSVCSWRILLVSVNLF
uniref:Reverse transcriptase domain-containing protein n=1 Tax=Sphaeramia orbicularis TaxID=375764 RepID=A0A672ZUN5_9TELE